MSTPALPGDATEAVAAAGTLADLRRGEHAVVVAVADARAAARLAARGLVPGVEVWVLRAGDPMLIGVDESRWALTRDDAGLIDVARVPAARRSLLRHLQRLF
jgi:Fe2+ transport system protein FeoA